MEVQRDSFSACPRGEASGDGVARTIRRRRLSQAIAAQAIFAITFAINRHRQARGFFRAPAGRVEAADKFRPAPGAGEASRGHVF